MRARKARPVMVGWEVTRGCNLRCPHCYTSATEGPRHAELTTKEGLALVDDLAALGTEVLGFTGGEPLRRDDLETLARRATRRGIECGVTTNGLLLDPARAARLKRAGIRTVQISLDGSTPERNARMRATPPESFDRVLEAVRVCRRLRLDVGFAMLLGAESIGDARPFLDLARREGVPWVRFCGFVPWGAGARDAVAKRHRIAGRVGELRRLVEESREIDSPVVMFDPGFGPTEPGYRFHRCAAGRALMYVGSTGDVYPCTSLLDPRFVVGNLRERPIRDLWSDPKMTAMSRYPQSAIRGRCATCGDRTACHGACRGIAYAWTGRLDAAFPVCVKPRSRPVSSSPSA